MFYLLCRTRYTGQQIDGGNSEIMTKWMIQSFEYVTILGHENKPDVNFETEYYFVMNEKQKAYQSAIEEASNY